MKLAPPKSLLRSTTDTGFPDGSLVTYENEGEMLLGCILRFKKARYVVWNERGRELELAPNRLHAVPGRLPRDGAQDDSAAARTKFLATLADSARARLHSIELEELWGVVRDTPREYSMRDLFEVLHGTSPKESQALEYLTLRFALAHDKIHFKREREGFIPRSAATVEDLRRAEKARERKLEKRATLAAWIVKRMSDPHTPLPEELEEPIELLELVAAGASHLDQAHHKEAKELVDVCAERLKVELHGSREQRAFRLLEKASWFSERTNLALIRHNPPRRFSKEALQAASVLVVPTKPSEYHDRNFGARKDLTGLECFTIDDVSTADMDDALSLERVPHGYRVGIHISDVASFITPDSLLDHTARARATSIYLPDQVLPMLPEELSEHKLSLVPGEVRPTVSCLATLSPTFKVQSAEICLSLIRSSTRYSYDQFEELLEKPKDNIGFLYELACAFEEERIEHGAQKVYKRDLIIDVAEDGSFSLREFDEHGPARSLVGELMVFANSLFARYAVDNKLPVVFRRQDPPEQTGGGTDGGTPVGPAADYAERAKMKKSSIGVTPGPHSGLGLEAYLQATSPIRRYVDLVNQRQIVQHLRGGTPPYTRAAVEEVIAATEQPLSTALTVSKETRRFWLLRFLKQRLAQNSEKGSVITGTVLRTDLKTPLVELDEIFLPTLVKFPSLPKVGDRVVLRIVNVDPQQDYLRLEPLARP